MPWRSAPRRCHCRRSKGWHCGSGYRRGCSDKLHQYLLELQPEVLPKSPSGAAVRYALNQWEALTRFLEDGELEIDNGATERANRDIALGRGNWTFFGSDGGGKTAAVLRSFIASCKRCGVEPFAWFRDVLSRIPAHSITRLSELLPHNWKPATSPAQALSNPPIPHVQESPAAVYETLTSDRHLRAERSQSV